MQKYVFHTDGFGIAAGVWIDPHAVDGTEFYLASDVDAVLKRQAAAAISGMNAATAISSGQLQQAHRLRAESSPESLESERAANAILTDRIAELESLLHECIKDDGAEHFLGTDLLERINTSLMVSVNK